MSHACVSSTPHHGRHDMCLDSQIMFSTRDFPNFPESTKFPKIQQVCQFLEILEFFYFRNLEILDFSDILEFELQIRKTVHYRLYMFM